MKPEEEKNVKQEQELQEEELEQAAGGVSLPMGVNLYD